MDHFYTNRGRPPIFANMTLDGIESILQNKYWNNKSGIIRRQNNKMKIHFIRYADDWIITANNKEVLLEIKIIIENFLKERGLELSREKTKLTHINTGFDFLGWNFRKYKNKLLIKPSKKSFEEIKSKIRNIFKTFQTITQENLIKLLNPIIVGWCNYHKKVVAKKTFSKLDNYIFNLLMQWTKRRHPNKSSSWIVKKYW